MEKKIYQIAKKALPNALFSDLKATDIGEYSFTLAPRPSECIFVSVSKSRESVMISVSFSYFVMGGMDFKQRKMFNGNAILLKNGNLNEGFFELLFTHYSSFGR